MDAQRRSSEFLDSELSPDTASAIRGHLRTCEDCQTWFAEEEAFVEAARGLPLLEPPKSVWEGIEARIAAEEIRDSQSWSWSRWLRVGAWPLAGVAAAAAIFLFWASSAEQSKLSESGASLSKAQTVAATLPMPMAFQEQQAQELSEADLHYLQSIQEMRDILEEDRPNWSAAEATAVDTQLALYRKTSIATRMGVQRGSVQGRDQLYANYRGEIDFLQSALAGDLP